MIRRFVELSDKITDAPSQYARLAGLYILSRACENTKLRLGGIDISLNLWLLIVGKSSRFHKSTIVRLVDEYHSRLGFNVISHDASREGLMKVMSINSNASLLISEFSFFMHNSRKEYMSGTLPFLADVYDCPSVMTRQTMAGEIKIENPNIGIFSASSGSWLRSSLKEVDIEGGFMARFMMCYPQSKEKEYIIPISSDRKEIGNLKRMITIGIKDIQAYSSHLDYICADEDALDFAKSYWKNAFKEECISDAILSRHVIYHLKIATILSLADIKKSVDLSHMVDAAPFVNDSLVSWSILLDLGIGGNFFNRVREKIMYAKNKKITRKELLKQFSTMSFRIDAIIQTLVQRGEITITKTKNKEVIYEVVDRSS